jgi:UDP:flavonoid glycosyltransferase YjiC (YdhE family)
VPAKRALLLPGYFGSGFGHIARSLVLASELARQQWSVALVVAGPHVVNVRRAGWPVYQPWFPMRPHRAAADESLAYLWIPDANFQVVRDGLTHPWMLQLAVAELQLIIRHFGPDVLIGDFSLLAWIAGQRAGLPVVQVIRAIAHPASPRLIWWQSPPPGLVSPDIRPVFEAALKNWGLAPIERAEDLFRGDLFLVPSVPELEPLPPGLSNTQYVGAMVAAPTRAAVLPEPLNGLKEKPVVYLTLGGGAATVGDRQFFKTINAAFADAPWQVIVSTGGKFAPTDLPPAPPNLFYYPWVPGSAVIPRSDLVIFHGGYGTMMETVRAGIPSLVLPFHSEQESNGRRLAACGAAEVLSPIADMSAMRLVRRRWRGGELATWMQPASSLTPTAVREAAHRVLTQSRYAEGARVLSAAAAAYAGAPAAVEWIGQLL